MFEVTFTDEMLTGKSYQHVVSLYSASSKNHFLHMDVVKPFQELQKSAGRAGFNLQPVSCFQDFQRQQTIWNSKFQGLRKVHDDFGNPLDLTTFSEWEKCQAILRWSALPGGSRHHWGTEIDIFDPNLLPKNQKLLLEPWEYEKSGYFFELMCWLQDNLADFDFYFPFLTSSSQFSIGREPWHISYLPIASQANNRFNQEILLQSWKNETIEAKNTLIEHLSDIFKCFLVK